MGAANNGTTPGIFRLTPCPLPAEPLPTCNDDDVKMAPGASLIKLPPALSVSSLPAERVILAPASTDTSCPAFTT
ncbi:hypothetical protein D3C75_1136250 [compost metagenome]